MLEQKRRSKAQNHDAELARSTLHSPHNLLFAISSSNAPVVIAAYLSGVQLGLHGVGCCCCGSLPSTSMLVGLDEAACVRCFDGLLSSSKYLFVKRTKGSFCDDVLGGIVSMIRGPATPSLDQ